MNIERLRTPFFIIALVAMALVVCVELGEHLIVGGFDAGTALTDQAAGAGLQVPAGGQVERPAGLGVPYLALVDVVALFTVALMAAGLVVPAKLQGRLQGIVTLVFAVLLVLAAIGLLVLAVAKLILMVTLLLAFPFGTIAYLIGFGFFPRGTATVILSLIMFLKFVFAGSLAAAQQRFLQNKGLVALVLTSLLCTVAVSFLHGVVPGVLASITDAVAGIVCAVAAIVWAVVLLVGAVVGIVTAAKATADEARSTALAVAT
ncbi:MULTISPECIES: hypothetical protein [Dactylosporangium]|uniref:Uncharacterized protein n=2 Tax=Dactylosporangium TaxID=35753 RepID=A0A9W6KMJ7_9ACTN|nr:MULTISPECIES: hypothetical protein [Dactylosporangium]GLL04786.1 hypothetical protein GCM10017581_065330 [Dactylosporangium matsuzakiense]